MACLESNTILDYVLGRLGADELAVVTAHVDGCATCGRLAADAARDADSRSDTLEAGAPFDRAAPAGVLASWESYRELTPIGSGGSGDVFKAYDPRLRRPVAIKFLRHVAPELARRFLAEARAQVRVEHANVCRVYEAGSLAGRPFIAMQLVDGATLLDARASMTLDERVRVMSQVAEAVHAAHQLGIVHRDLKPTNVLVERRDDRAWVPYVMDFGLARDLADDGETVSGTLLGTPAYMAPEQARGAIHEVDRRADVYALGATLYAALTGHAPFSAPSVAELLSKVLHEEPTPPRRLVPSLPRDLEVIALKCLEKAPERRYPSARALADDLQRWLRGEPIVGRRAPLERLLARVRRNRALFAVGGAALVGLVTAGAVAIEARLASSARARAAADLGAASRELESWMRMQRLLPLHDLRPAFAVVRARMRALEERRLELGATAEGPARYALGRGHLELREYDEARADLQAAWDAQYRAPQVAYALGRALAAIYERETRRLEGVAETTRAREQPELERRYRDPALAFLAQARTAEVESPAFVEAQLAWTDRRLDDAVRFARKAEVEAPWLYEAPRLEGDADALLAIGRDRAGALDEARALDDAAGAAFARALAIGRSDEETYLGECRRLVFRASASMLHEEYSDTAVAAAAQPCRQARAIDPALAEAYREEADLYHHAARFLLVRARPVDATLTRLGAIADEAERAGVGWQASVVRAQHFGLRAAVEEARGGDARAARREAVAAYQRAADAHHDGDSLDKLAGALMQLAAAERDHGESPLASYRRGAAVIEEIDALPQKLEPTFLVTATGLYSSLAEYEVNHGLDAASALARASAFGSRAADAFPRLADNHSNLAFIELVRADYARMTGADPRPSLDACEAAVRRAIALAPGDQSLAGNLAEEQLLRARWNLDEGGDPAPALAAARAALDTVAPAAGAARRAYLDASYETLSARAAIKRGADPSEHFARALAAAHRGGAPDGDLLAARAEALRWEAEWRGADPRGAQLLDAALESARAAARVDPAATPQRWLISELLLLASRRAQPPERDRLRADARAASSEALRLNGNERWAHRRALAEAEDKPAAPE